MKKVNVFVFSVTIMVLLTSQVKAQWTTFSNPSNKALHSVYFINSMTGFTCGDTGTVLKSTSGGTSWVNSNTGISSSINVSDIQFLDANTGYCAGGVGSISGKIYKSTNGGVNWIFTSVPGEFADFKFVMFTNSTTGYAGGLKFGGNGVMGKTTNGGLTWSVLAGYNSATPYEASYITNDLVYVVRTDDTISVTTNGGLSWSNQYASTGGFDKSISIKNGLGVTAGRNLAVNVTVGVEPLSGEVPDSYNLGQNYPNPFNPSTKIVFAIPQKGIIKITVYNSLGQEMKQLVNEIKTAGMYSVVFDASEFPSGVYYYKLNAGEYTSSKKMILIK